MASREEFAGLLADLAAVKAEISSVYDENHPLRQEARDSVIRAIEEKIKASGKKRSKKAKPIQYQDWAKYLDWDTEMKPLDDAASAKFEAFFNPLRKREAELKSRLDTMTEVLSPLPGDKKCLLSVSYSSTYSTQGFGHVAYAEKNAKLHMIDAQSCGIRCEIERRDQKREPRTYQHCFDIGPGADFYVWVFVQEDMDVEILQRKTVPLRDWVKWCWKLGANPRVFNPFLPSGYEESVGLDFLGNDLRPDSPSR